jgi:UDP-glucose 4-epimerase
VLGGCGFLGSHIVDVLLEEGIEVIVLDRRHEKFRLPLGSVSYVLSDFGNRKQLDELLGYGIDVVIHLVSTTTPRVSNDNPIFDVQTNLIESLRLFELCVAHKVGKVVFISSGGTVYGINSVSSITEEYPTLPICSYGIVKLAIEKYLHLYKTLYGLNSVIFRLSNLYGIRQDPHSDQGFIPIIMAKMLRGEKLTIWGDGSTVRDYIHVRDVARLCYLAAVSKETGVFNAGSGVGISLNELINAMAFQCGVKPELVREPPRKFDVPHVVLNCKKANKAFSWKPVIELNEGLLEMERWLKSGVIDLRSQINPAPLQVRPALIPVPTGDQGGEE